MNHKKKILHLIQSLDNGGCENMLLRTLPLLGNFEHKIITLKELGELTPKFVSAGITVATVRCGNLLDIAGIQRLRKLVGEEKTDIIITYLFHADMLGRLFLRSFLSFRAKPRNLTSCSSSFGVELAILRVTPVRFLGKLGMIFPELR